MYTVYLLFAKSLRTLRVRSTAVVFAQSTFTAAVMLVPGLVAVAGADYSFSAGDLLMAALLGLVTTAFSFSLFMDGLHYIRVQHAGIMGYIEPVSAPFYALVFLGQGPRPGPSPAARSSSPRACCWCVYGRGEPEAELIG